MLGGLHSVERTALLAIRDAGGVESPANDLVADARDVLDATAANKDQRVLLQVVPLTGDVARHLEPVREADPGDLPQRRVRLLRRHGGNPRADPPPLWSRDALLATVPGLEARGRGLLLLVGSSLPDELIGVRHGGGV